MFSNRRAIVMFAAIFAISLSGCAPKTGSITDAADKTIAGKTAAESSQTGHTSLVSEENLSQLTQSDIEKLSEQELVELGQRLKQGNFTTQERKHSFSDSEADSSDIIISKVSALDLASAKKTAQEFFTPANDSYWYNGLTLIEDTEHYWLFKSYYNNHNVTDKPQYLLVFANSYYNYETSEAGFELNEENIREFMSIYGIFGSGFCLAEFVNEEADSFQYVHYGMHISGGDYGMYDTLYLEKYTFVFRKENHELEQYGRQELKTVELPGTLHEEDERSMED